MKKLTIIFITIISLFSAIQINTFNVHAKSVDDVYDEVIEIWNYLNNTVVPEIQKNAGGGSVSQDDITDIKDKVDKIDVKKDIEDYFDDMPEDDGTVKGYILSFGESIKDTAKEYWNGIGENITNSNKGEFKVPFLKKNKELKIEDYIENTAKNTAYNIFRNLGYSLVLLFFSMSLIESTIKLDAFSVKGGAMLFGRLIVSKVVIDMAGKVCIAILDVCTKTCNDLLQGTSKIKFEGNIADLWTKSDVKFVGGIIDIFSALCIVVPVLIITVPIVICSILILIKLITRGLELTMLSIVSPAFFACYSSDVTKQYFRTFVVTFLQVALQIVFMMVVFYIGSEWVDESMSIDGHKSVISWMLAMIPNLLFIIVITKMIVKPPKVLTNLVSH